VVGATAENASLFLSYRELQKVIKNLTGKEADYQLPLEQLMIAAAGAGVITSFILCVPQSFSTRLLSRVYPTKNTRRTRKM
jgi:hypothetical protein